MSNSPWLPDENPDARRKPEGSWDAVTPQPLGALGHAQSPVIRAQGEPASSTQGLKTDPLVDRYDLVYLLKKNLFGLTLAPIVCAALGVFFYLKQEKLYESSALLMMDSGLNQRLQFGSTDSNSDHVRESLKSFEVAVVADSIILRVVNRLDLKNAPGFLPANLGNPADLPDTELVHFLRENRVQATLQPETRLIRIAASDPQPERARQITEAFVDEFEGFLAGQRKGESPKVRESIEKQIEEAKTAAFTSEASLKEYREQNADLPMEQDHVLLSSRLAQLGEDLNTAARERVEMESTLESIKDIDPKTNPVDIIEIADYQTVSHVSSLLSALNSSKSRLAAAAQRFTEANPSYLAAKAEVDRNNELLEEQAAGIKKTFQSRYEASLKREQSIETELAALQTKLVEMKSKSSELRVLQTEAENKRQIFQDLQKRLGSTVMSTELPGNIATVVSEPLTPFKDSRSPIVLFVAAGLVLGCAISVGWVLIKLLSGLPFTDTLQLENHLGLPVIADWTKESKSAMGTPTPAMMQTMTSNRAKTIQVSAPGLNSQGVSVAENLAQLAAASGRKTLLLLVEPGAQQASIAPTAINNLHRLAISPENVMDERAFPDVLSRFRELYDKIVIEAGALDDPAAVNWISHFSEQDIVAVGCGAISKSEIASRVRSLYRPDAAPVALMLVNPKPSEKKSKQKPATPPVPSGPVRPANQGQT